MDPGWMDEVTTLTFDCYGTLIDWERGIVEELRPWAERRGHAASDDDLLAAFADHESACQQAMPAAPYPEVLEAVFRRIAAGFGVEATGEEARAFGRSVPRWPAFPDSPAALAELTRRFRLIVISNVDRASFEGSRKRLGVDFDRVVTAEEMGFYKPDPRAFPHLIDDLGRSLGAAPPRILHVAQSLFHDIAPAKAAGLRTVWINRRAGRGGWGATPPSPGGAEPDLEFATMAEFAAFARRG